MADPDEKNGVTNVLGPPNGVVRYARAGAFYAAERVIKGPALSDTGPRLA